MGPERAPPRALGWGCLSKPRESVLGRMMGPGGSADWQAGFPGASPKAGIDEGAAGCLGRFL